MSRFTYTNEAGFTINWGDDHAIGIWIDVSTPDEEEMPIIDKCQLFDGLTRRQQVAILREYGVPNPENPLNRVDGNAAHPSLWSWGSLEEVDDGPE